MLASMSCLSYTYKMVVGNVLERTDSIGYVVHIIVLQCFVGRRISRKSMIKGSENFAMMVIKSFEGIRTCELLGKLQRHSRVQQQGNRSGL